MAAGGFQLAQHGADDFVDAAAETVHGAGGAGAGKAAQPEVQQHFRREGRAEAISPPITWAMAGVSPET